MKKLLAIFTAMLLSCTFIFSQETIKISQIDAVSKGIKFDKKKDKFKNVTVITGKKLTGKNPIAIDLSKYANKEVEIKFYCDIKIEDSKKDVNEIIWMINDFNEGFPEIAKKKVKTGEWTRMTGSKIVHLTGPRQLYIPTNSIDLENSKIFLKDFEVTITGESLTGKPVKLKNWLEVEPLKNSLKSHFDYFGIAVGWNDTFAVPNIQKGVAYHASSITMGNEFKPDFIFRWSLPRQFKDFKGENGKKVKVPSYTLKGFETCADILEATKKNNLEMRGHVLVWHSQTPDWFFTENYDYDSELVDKDTMNARMEWYIKTVLEFVANWEKENNNGKHIIKHWDVVNEACADGATDQKWLREDSNWFKIYGSEEFIVNAFRYANKYAPKDVSLVYNDYSSYNGSTRSANGGGKTNAILKVVDAIQAAPDARIDAVGMQSHVQMEYPPVSGNVNDSFEAAVKKFIAKGVNVQITELDIANAKKLYSPMKLKAKYKEYFEMFIRNKKTANKKGIEGVTIWGVTDDGTWLNSQSQYKGHTQYPLLFTEDYECKPAFFGIVEAAE